MSALGPSEASERILNALKLIEKNGCDCECDHHWEDHDEECERCLACLIEHALNPHEAEGGGV